MGLSYYRARIRTMRAHGFRDYFTGRPTLTTVWLSAPVFVAALASLLSPIRPFDYFWALAQGRAIVQLGRIPAENLFLFTVPVDAPFVNQPWLAELAMFGAYRLGGHSANVLLLATCHVFALVWLMDGALRSGASAKLVAWAGLVATVCLAPGSGVRTQMFAYVCFAVVLRQAVSDGAVPTFRALARVFVFSALWANLHGSFVLAPLIVAVGALGRVLGAPPAERPAALRAGALTLGAALAGTCVTPQGPRVYAYVLRIGDAMQVALGTDVTEWQPLSWSDPLTLVFAGIVLGGVLVAIVRRSQVRFAAVALWLLFAALSLKSQRFLGWWALTTIPALSALAPPSAFSGAKPGVAWLNGTLLALLVAVVIACLPGGPVFERVLPGSRVPYAGHRALGIESPIAIARTLAERGYAGNLFHDQAVGGLLEWALCADGPRPVAFVDQRFELIPASLWQEYFAILQGGDAWEALLERRGVRTLVLHEDRNPLAAVIERDARWHLVQREFGYRLYMRPLQGVR